MINAPRWRHFDPILIVAALALTGYGALLIYSAALPRGAEGVVITDPVRRHIIVAGLGALAMITTTRLDYRLTDVLGWFAYGLGVVLLCLVLVAGTSEFGARRWFDLGFTLVQASEVAKVLTIIGLAKFLSDRRDRMDEWRVFFGSLGIAVLPAFLVLVEPDAGSSVMFLVLWGAMVIFAGARWKHLAALVAAVMIVAPIAFVAGIQDYQRERLEIFLDPTEDPQGGGFNVLQAETSVGSGGLWGKGLTQGTQTQLDFLRTQTTDFIFSVLGEELGFAGAMALFALFLLLLLRGLRTISLASDPLGQLLAVGIVTLIATQAFINVGVNVRLIPVTGIPLPFISVGNSSLLMLFVALGILQSVLVHRETEREATPYPRFDA